MRRGKRGRSSGGGPRVAERAARGARRPRRIQGGVGRGRRLDGRVPPATRPTAARVRQAIFDVLGGRIAGAVFLDAYAGTGAVGIEALARGARRVVFIERDPGAVRGIHADLGPAEAGNAEVIAADVALVLERLHLAGTRFTIVFLDPPYGDPGLRPALDRAAALVAPGGILMVEHRRDEPIDPPAGGIVAGGRTYRHGDTALTTFIFAAGVDR